MMAQNIHQLEALIGNAERIVNQLRALVAQSKGDAREWLEERMRSTDRGLSDLRRELTQLANKLQTATIREALKKTPAAERTSSRPAQSSATSVSDATAIGHQPPEPSELPCAVLSDAGERPSPATSPETITA